VQDQVAIGSRWQAIGGVRVDRFALRLDNRRNGQTLRRTDRLVSPRAGLVFKPATPVSVYSSYSVSYLPSSGDQFASLTPPPGAQPERFTNEEAGAKWDVADRLALTAAAYRLDRTNTAAPDPSDPTRTVQTGSQRTTGVELGATGEVTSAWQVAGGFTAQRAELTNTTAAARAGATVPLVPGRSASLWNRVRLSPALGVGLGIVRQGAMYAAVDNTVTLPAFTRYDAAAFVGLGRGLRAQLNVENLLDARYYATSHGNNNIMPGATRTVRLTLATGM
jgi:catecholate siderophore receptor